MSSMVDHRLRHGYRFRWSTPIWRESLIAIRLIIPSSIPMRRLLGNLKADGKRNVKLLCFINSTSISAMRSARIQESAVARPKDAPTDYPKQQLPYKQTLCTIFFGNYFPPCLSHPRKCESDSFGAVGSPDCLN